MSAPTPANSPAPIDVAFLGSCTNGRLSDFQEVAKFVKGRKVSPGVKAIAVPGSQIVGLQCEKLGLDTQDASNAAIGFLNERKATFPSLRDRDRAIRQPGTTESAARPFPSAGHIASPSRHAIVVRCTLFSTVSAAGHWRYR